MKIRSADELRDSYLAKEKELEEAVSVNDGVITINVHGEYNIELNRCDTPEKIIAWVLHLGDKTWMSREILQRFVVVALRANELDIPLI